MNIVRIGLTLDQCKKGDMVVVDLDSLTDEERSCMWVRDWDGEYVDYMREGGICQVITEPYMYKWAQRECLTVNLRAVDMKNTDVLYLPPHTQVRRV